MERACLGWDRERREEEWPAEVRLRAGANSPAHSRTNSGHHSRSDTRFSAGFVGDSFLAREFFQGPIVFGRPLTPLLWTGRDNYLELFHAEWRSVVVRAVLALLANGEDDETFPLVFLPRFRRALEFVFRGFDERRLRKLNDEFV